MQAILEALKDPGNMSNSQWVMIAMMLFILVGSFYFVYRLYRIIETDRKSTYVPNIGRKRLGEQAEEESAEKITKAKSEKQD